MLDDLKEAVLTGKAIVVVGAGLAISVTSNSSSASWQGLVEDGLTFLKKNSSEFDEEWEDLTRRTLAYSFEKGNIPDYLRAVSSIVEKIREIGSQAHANWLTESIGALIPSNPQWIESIVSMNCPILTTNIDSLIERVAGRESADWRQSHNIQRILTRKSRSIGHLHGLWSEPDSVILTDGDYAKLISNAGTQGLQQAASAIQSFVYVGFGAGIGDPNFGRLRKWHSSIFPNSTVQHFRLCLSSELAELTKAHANENIEVISFGDTYEEFPGFIDGLGFDKVQVLLSTEGLTRNIAQEARESIEMEMRRETIIAERLTDLESKHFHELAIQPRILPVPNERYLESKRAEGEDEFSQLVPLKDFKEGDVIILAAEENSGLSTALSWLLLELTSGTELMPVEINFRSFTRGAKPIERELTKFTRSLGLGKGGSESLPPHILAIDDFAPFAKNVSDNAIGEIGNLRAYLTMIGCRRGEETAIIDRLKDLGIEAKISYLGRLKSADVRALATIAAPSESPTIASAVLSVIRAFHLPMNPFTVSLLISILERGSILAANASPTSILDQYVNLLLGRGDLLADSRFALDSVALEAILSDVAEMFVVERTGSVTETQIISRMSEFFQNFGWKESAIVVLENLIERRILRRDADKIKFSQSSYLFLFAAKQALKKDEFLADLKSKPLFFSPILRHYAALSTRDSEMLRELDLLLDEWVDRSWLGEQYEEESFTSSHAIAAPVKSVDIPGEIKEGESPSDAANGEILEDYFDGQEFGDLLPFPLTEESEMPDVIRFSATLELVSSVLRDSDQVPDQELKGKVLKRTLRAWGEQLNALNEDPVIQELLEQIGSSLAEALGKDEEKSKELSERVVKMLPPAIVMGGISANLASRKLLISLEAALDDPDFSGHAPSAVAAAMFLATLSEPGWVVKFS
jgi:hypothetical protein